MYYIIFEKRDIYTFENSKSEYTIKKTFESSLHPSKKHKYYLCFIIGLCLNSASTIVGPYNKLYTLATCSSNSIQG